MHQALYLLFCAAAGLLLANAVPHIVHGVSGRPFQSPFATPPGEGLSSAVTNSLWGFANLAAAYAMLVWAVRFDPRSVPESLAVGIGLLLGSVVMARLFGRFHGGNNPGES